MPPLFHPINPLIYWTELVYTLVIVILCAMIYLKASKVFNLTRHKGIWFFGSAFLFFGLAYATRFLFHLASSQFFALRMRMPIALAFVGFFSTLAIFSLIHSSIWKKVNDTLFLVFSSLAAVTVSFATLIYRSPNVLALFQLLLLAFAVALVLFKHTKKFSQAKILYILLLVFWLISLVLLQPPRFMLYELRIAMQALSLGLFGFIFYRVAKWIK